MKEIPSSMKTGNGYNHLSENYKNSCQILQDNTKGRHILRRILATSQDGRHHFLSTGQPLLPPTSSLCMPLRQCYSLPIDLGFCVSIVWPGTSEVNYNQSWPITIICQFFSISGLRWRSDTILENRHDSMPLRKLLFTLKRNTGKQRGEAFY